MAVAGKREFNRKIGATERRSKGGEFLGKFWYVVATKVPPQKRLARSRRRNALAKASRRANR